jgi:hypothetical protein
MDGIIRYELLQRKLTVIAERYYQQIICLKNKLIGSVKNRTNVCTNPTAPRI